MVPHTEVELSAPCQAIVANENRLLITKVGTTEGEVRKFTE